MALYHWIKTLIELNEINLFHHIIVQFYFSKIVANTEALVNSSTDRNSLLSDTFDILISRFQVPQEEALFRAESFKPP